MFFLRIGRNYLIEIDPPKMRLINRLLLSMPVHTLIGERVLNSLSANFVSFAFKFLKEGFACLLVNVWHLINIIYIILIIITLILNYIIRLIKAFRNLPSPPLWLGLTFLSAFPSNYRLANPVDWSKCEPWVNAPHWNPDAHWTSVTHCNPAML